MRFILRRCGRCMAYTLWGSCPACGSETSLAHPAKFSPDDKYRRYRLASKYRDRG